MMIFILGIIVGLLIALIVLMISLWSKPVIERQLKQVQSQLREKGRVIEPDNEELGDWVKSLPHE